MSGQLPADVFSGGVVWTVLSQTQFGRDWIVRLVLACLLAGTFAPLLSAQWKNSGWLAAAAVVLAASFVGGLAWAGHAAGGEGVEAFVHPAADVLYLVAAAAWVGALIPLALLLAAIGLANINRLFLVWLFAHIGAKSCRPTTWLCPRTFAPAIWPVAATTRRCHIRAMHRIGGLAHGRIHQSSRRLF
jgi:putative copper resistance protein D